MKKHPCPKCRELCYGKLCKKCNRNIDNLKGKQGRKGPNPGIKVYYLRKVG